MKKTLLFIALITSTTFFAQTELVQNGTADDFINASNETGPPVIVKNVDDNADAWDMTPNSTVVDNSGAEVASPYRYDADDNPTGWRNDDLETYLEVTYNAGGSVNEQPGSTSDGNYNATEKTRGVKLYGETRRLYQRVVVEAGVEYTFSMESRSNAANTPSEVFMLNEAITTEVGLENKASDSRVDHYFEITNDENSSGGSVGNNTFTTTTFDFTASTTDVVIYVRALLSTADNQVYFDNISLKKKATASVNDVFSSKISIYPNPANEFVQISTSETITGVEVYNLIGKKVISSSKLTNNKIDVSNLSKGVYILKVMSNDLVGSRKIIIE
jgi:hypothetical protein